MRIIRNIPTNVILGFLGVGKTSAVLDFLRHKPDSESWSVLVNEFGEIGIDGDIYERQGVAVKEIPGGCMCCAQGLPLQVAVNRLLRETVPDRLLIETSGIGHPVGVLKTLQGEGFAGVLDLKAVITLVDPEQLLDPACARNELFAQQLALADVLVANKIDLASARALEAFDGLSERFSIPKALSIRTVRARTEARWLDMVHTPRLGDAKDFKPTAPAAGEWQTFQWTFPADVVFGFEALRAWIEGLHVVRMKGVVNTSAGPRLFNYARGSLETGAAEPGGPTRLQIIDRAGDGKARQQREDELLRSLETCISAASPEG